MSVSTARWNLRIQQAGQSSQHDLKGSVVGAIPAPDPGYMFDPRRSTTLFNVLVIAAATVSIGTTNRSLFTRACAPLG